MVNRSESGIMSVNRFLFRCQLQFKTDAARTRPVVVVDKTYNGGVAEDTDVDIRPSKSFP